MLSTVASSNAVGHYKKTLAIMLLKRYEEKKQLLGLIHTRWTKPKCAESHRLLPVTYRLCELSKFQEKTHTLCKKNMY